MFFGDISLIAMILFGLMYNNEPCRWWFQICFFMFTAKIGEMIQSDEHISSALHFSNIIQLIYKTMYLSLPCSSKTKQRMVVRIIQPKDYRSFQWAKFGRHGLPGLILFQRVDLPSPKTKIASHMKDLKGLLFGYWWLCWSKGVFNPVFGGCKGKLSKKPVKQCMLPMYILNLIVNCITVSLFHCFGQSVSCDAADLIVAVSDENRLLSWRQS